GWLRQRGTAGQHEKGEDDKAFHVARRIAWARVHANGFYGTRSFNTAVRSAGSCRTRQCPPAASTWLRQLPRRVLSPGPPPVAITSVPFKAAGRPASRRQLAGTASRRSENSTITCAMAGWAASCRAAQPSALLMSAWSVALS